MFDIHQTITDEYGERDEIKVRNYIDGLMADFAESPEAKPLQEADEDLGWAAMLIESYINYIGSTPSEMTLRDFNEVLFSIFPRKVSVEAEEAGSIIAGLRAFWRFVARQYGLANAQTILATLDDAATSRLQKKLADPASFGMAKSFFMLGSKAGFDMTTPEGLAAFQTVYNAQLLGGQPGSQPPGLPPARPDLFHSLPPSPLDRPTSDELKKKRKEKKRQRDAKKRNRPR